MRTLDPVVVDAQGLSKSYGPRAVLDDISFRLEPGTITAFLGRNGAGKSTTVRMLASLASGGGSVAFNGRPLFHHAHPRSVLGVDLGGDQAHPGRTVRHHLALLARQLPDGRQRVDEVVSQLGIHRLLDRRPRSFSTGMRRSVALASVLLPAPSVLILDEPINGLEAASVQRVKDLLARHAQAGGTVLVASHVLAELERLADRVLLLDGGRIAADSTLTSYLEHHRPTQVEVIADDPPRLELAFRTEGWTVRTQDGGVVLVEGQDLRTVAAVTHRTGVLVLGLRERRATLEEAFLDTPARSAGRDGVAR